jgi:uncharacterized protein YjbJ (UPF0337 family)
MRKLPRIILKSLIWTVSSILLLVILLITYLALFFPNEYVKNLIISQGKQKLGRVVNIESLNVSLFSGIKIKNFSVYDASVQGLNLKGGKIFIKAGEVNLSYRLLPILWKKLEIKKAVIKKPEIHVVRFKNGNFNFSDIIKKLTSPSEGSPSTAAFLKHSDFLKKAIHAVFLKKPTGSLILASSAPQNAKTKEAKKGMEFDIKEVGLKNAVISFTDYKNEALPAVYTIDKFNFIIKDIDSSNYKKGAKLLITFQVSMKRIENSMVQSKTFNIFTTISGNVFMFDKKGNIKTNPGVYLKIDFKDGLVSGTQIQKIINNIMEDLKEKFFKEYAKRLKDIIKNFDVKLKEKAALFLNKFSGKADTLISGLIKSRDRDINQANSGKAGAIAGYKEKANSALAKIEVANKKFTTVLQSIAKISLLVPGSEGNKIRAKISEYSKKSNTQLDIIKKRMNNDNPGGMSKEINAIVGKIKKQYGDVIKNIKTKFNTFVDKYVKTIKNKVLKQLNSLTKRVDAFKLNLPFLKKELKFDYGNLYLSYDNGVATIKKLYIGSSSFKIKSESTTYNTGNGGISSETNIEADKKYNTNVFTNFFASQGEDIHIPVTVSGTFSKPNVKISGTDIANKFKEFALRYAAILAKKYLGADIPVDKILGPGPASGGDLSSQINAIKNKYINRLLNDQKLHDKFLKELENKFRAEVSPGGRRSPVPANLRRRLRF